MNKQAAEIVQINMELGIDKSPEQVWTALTQGIGDWWPADFYAGGEEGGRDFTLEAWPGGRMFESWADNGGVLWGTVVTVEPNVRLQVLGVVFPNWGGPTQWYGTWELKAQDGGTLLTFSEVAVGRVSDEGAAEKDKGWQFLWANLKAHLEGGPAPAWPE